MSKYLLGIDVGTQSLRVGIFDFTGNCITIQSAEYETYYPNVSWAEQKATDWWEAAKFAVRKALEIANIKVEDIAGIGYDTFSCTVLPVDKMGHPLNNAILWMDVRAVNEAEEISTTGHHYLKYAGGWVSPEWMLPKALWLKRNKPDIYFNADKIIECTDWFSFKLTGKWTLSQDHISSKWNYVKTEGGFPKDLLHMIGLEDLMEKWPKEIYNIGDRIGYLTLEAAQDLGLIEGIPVAQGGIDAHLGMLGLGAVDSGDMALIMGSSTCHMALAESQVFTPGIWGPFDEAIIPQKWVLEGGQISTGSIVKWFKDNFAYEEVLEAKDKNINVYSLLDERTSRIPPGAEGLVLLDYWQGNRSPLKDPKARGVIWGLGLKHTKEHILRAIYEGTAFGTRYIIETLKNNGVNIKKIYAGGGGAQSRLWLQIHSDICKIPIYISEETESMVLGAAICASVGAEIYDDLCTASRNMVKIKEVIEPNEKNYEVYDFYFNKYKETYFALRDLMHETYNYNLGDKK